MKRTIAIAAALALLGACSGGGEETNNSGVTPEEAAALDNGADMLDTSPDSLIAANDTALGNGEMPAEEVGNTGELPVTDTPVNAQ